MREQLAALVGAAERLEPHRADVMPADPVKWLSGHGIRLWSKQREIVEKLSNYRAQVAAYTSNGVGKTFLATLLATHFALKHRQENAAVVFIVASWDQAHAGSIREFKNAENRNIQYPGVFRQGRNTFDVDGRTMIWWRSPGDTGRNVIQGVHAEKMLVILEEANEIGYRTWVQAVDAITSGGDARILAIGNPTDTGTPFHEACTAEDSGWDVVHIGTLDTPNFTGEAVPKAMRDRLPNETWFKQKRRTMTEADFRTRVMGLFPARSEFALIDPLWITDAMKETHLKKVRKDSPAIIAVDPGSGGDPTVVGILRDNVFRFLKMGELEHSRDRDKVASHIGALAVKHGARAVVVDSFGVGADFGPPLHAAAPKVKIVMLNTGDRQKLKKWQARDFENPRALLAWRLVERLRDRTIYLQDHPKLAGQLAELRQEPTRNGRRMIEHKDDMKERLNRSPDHLDCLLMAMWRTRNWDAVMAGLEPS